MVQAVRQTLVEKHVKHICITGNVPPYQRGIDVDVFQTDPQCKVAVLTIQAASMVRLSDFIINHFLNILNTMFSPCQEMHRVARAHASTYAN